MIYGYIRVSTEKQSTHVQKFEINQYCERNGLTIDSWIDETISGVKALRKRKLSQLLRRLSDGDTVVCTEISRLGRSMQVVWRIMDICLRRNVTIISLKENYRLGNDPMSKFILSVYAYAAETERNLISERTKEGLAARKRAGVVLGRPAGALSKNLKLDPYKSSIISLLRHGVPLVTIAKCYNVNVSTVHDYLNRRGLRRYQKDPVAV